MSMYKIGMTVIAVAILAGLTLNLVSKFYNGDSSIAVRATLSLPKVESEAYRVDALGNDLRAYEWVSQTQEGKSCVFVVAKDGKAGLSCF